MLGTPAAHPDGRTLQAQIKAWRGKVFVFLTDRRVPTTNNISEREIRPSVVFRKVTNGFRSEWGAGVHAGYRLEVTHKLTVGCRAPPHFVEGSTFWVDPPESVVIRSLAPQLRGCGDGLVGGNRDGRVRSG